MFYGTEADVKARTKYTSIDVVDSVECSNKALGNPVENSQEDSTCGGDANGAPCYFPY